MSPQAGTITEPVPLRFRFYLTLTNVIDGFWCYPNALRVVQVLTERYCLDSL
jgi:hypothetical protein